MTLAVYGTEFEEDEEDDARVSKKPTPIQEQIATDEKGRRRFHGAFSGGFSAGYFNTVGSKIGWLPGEFRSSKDERAELNQQRAEDIMDEEDLGEFGIGARRIRQVNTFTGGGGPGTKRRLAWEHDETSVSSLNSQLQNIIRPVSDSIGSRMLRAMGWREGRGVGLATAKQVKSRGGLTNEAEFDREQVSRLAPKHNLALDDEALIVLKTVEGVHGLGYQGLQQTTVLDERMGHLSSALKLNKKSRGIKGQAFGVGAFEEEDESVYTNFDLSQYDFSIDGPVAIPEPHSIDSAFEEMTKRLNPRKFYAPPRLPPNFTSKHKPFAMDAAKLPDSLKKAIKGLTVVQRAHLLGEDRISLMELVGDKDRKRLDRIKGASRWDRKADSISDEREQGEPSSDLNRVVFPDEPMKQKRFKEFLTYLRRSLLWPKPSDMSVWEWESEKKDFEEKLTVDERAMLPEVRSRAQPLMKTSLALPIQELLKSKFTKETGSSGNVGRRDEDKMSAVKMNMFGERTRTTFEWYPANALTKRFNVPSPYPGATMIGVPHLQKAVKAENINNLGLSTTESAMFMRMSDTMFEPENSSQNHRRSSATTANEAEGDVLALIQPKEQKDEERPPDDIFAAIFGPDSSSDSESDDEEETEKRYNELVSPNVPSTANNAVKPSTSKEKVFTVMDIVEEFGPAPPPRTSNEEQALTGFSVVRYLEDELRSRKKHKKSVKSNKKHKKEKKSKKEKSKKSRKHKKKESNQGSPDSRASSSDSDSDIHCLD